MSNPAERLMKMGIEIPTLVPPIASYVPYVKTGNLVFVSGQVGLEKGKLAITGQLGATVSLEQGQAQARLAAINLLAILNHASGGDLRAVKRIVKITGFVSSTVDFTDHPKVVNGASDFFIEVFGDAGRHSRAAVGVASLPLGASVEVELVAEIA